MKKILSNIFSGKDMQVYHGSDILVKNPIIMTPIMALDFGSGFYTTTNIEQARNFSKIVQERNGSANRNGKQTGKRSYWIILRV